MKQPNLKTHMTICAPRPPPLQHLPVSTHDEPQSMAQQIGLCLLLATPTWNRLSRNFPAHFSHTWMPTPLQTKQSVEVARAANSGYQKAVFGSMLFLSWVPVQHSNSPPEMLRFFFRPHNFMVFSHVLPSCKVDGDIWSLGIKTFFTEERAVLSGCFYILRRFLLVFCWFLLAPFLRVSIYEFSGERSFILKNHTWKLQWYNSPRLASKCQTMQLWQSRDCQKGKNTTRTSYNCNGGDCQNLLWQMVL